jgi:hypothetical protein
MHAGVPRLSQELVRSGVNRSHYPADALVPKQMPTREQDAGAKIPGRVWFARMSGLCLSSLFLSLLLSCSRQLQPCRNVTTSEEISPNGQLKAVTFRRLCPEEHSATTDVSIIRAKEALPDGNGNVFGYDNEIAIRVSWLSDSRLAVYTYADPAKATRIERAGNVSIEYSRIIETALVPPIPDAVPTGSATPTASPNPTP